MISILMMTHDEREAQILKSAFEQRGFKILLSKPNYQNYVMSIQYTPDLILMEMPRICTEHLHFAALIRKHKRTKTIPVIGYGDPTDSMLRRGMMQQGVTQYLDRPLKFSLLLQLFERLLKAANKKIEVRPAPSDKEKDIELILNSQTPPMAKIEAMTRHVSSLLAFPFTIAKVLKITQDEKSGAADLAHAVTADPSISTHLLKLSNSVFFASANRRIENIKDAIVRIGFLETKKIVMSMSVMKVFDQHYQTLGFDRVDFWYHSLSTALIAERVARQMGGINQEEAFLAGLLHDLGILLFDEFFPTVFDRLLEQTTSKGGHFPDQSTALLGVNHNDLIAALFPLWKMPQAITEAIVNQYRINQFKDQLDSEGKRLALCVAIGNTVSKTLHLGRECDDYIFPLRNWVFDSVRMHGGIPRGFIDDVYKDIDTFRRFLSLEDRDYPQTFDGIENASARRAGILNSAADRFVPPREYLTKEGLTITHIKNGDAASSYDGKLDIVIVWAGPGTTADEILPYAHIVKYYEKMPEGAGAPECAPLLVMIPPNHPLMENCPEKVSLMYNEFDLRNLDRTMSELLEGKVVRPKPAAAATGQKAEEPVAAAAVPLGAQQQET